VVKTEAVDLVLLDRMLPDGDGATFCEALKDDPVTHGIPVILLTSRGSVEDRVDGLQRGADDYIAKPFHAGEFLARIRACLRALWLQRELTHKAEELALKNLELEQAQQRLIQKERLAAIGEVGLAIRHDVNNPLGTVLGYTDLLLAQPGALPAEAVRKLESIRRAALRIRDVVRRLEGIQHERTVEYIEGINMIDLREEGNDQ
jgi:response regulator RpfG family c-di-GMP phosphodiesterase